MTTPSRHRCAFCDQSAKLTKEHLWSKWTRDHLTYDNQKHQKRFIAWGVDGPTERRRTYGSDARHSGPRAPCRECNGGWMGAVETAAQAFLIPLLKGESAVLDQAGQKAVATWLTMKAMVGEYFDPEHIAVPLQERQYLRDSLQPPDNWRVWIGNYERQNWAGQWLHGSAGVQSKQYPARDTSRPNTQTTTFVIGNLYANVLSSEVRHLVSCVSLGETGRTKLAQIWPVQQPLISWPLIMLDDTDADICLTALFEGLRDMFPATASG